MQEITEEQWLQKPEAEQKTWREAFQIRFRHKHNYGQYKPWIQISKEEFDKRQAVGIDWYETRRIYRKASPIQWEGETDWQLSKKVWHILNDLALDSDAECNIVISTDSVTLVHFQLMEMLSAKDKEIELLKQAHADEMYKLWQMEKDLQGRLAVYRHALTQLP